MKRFLGLSAEEIAENERLWREENKEAGSAQDQAAAELRGVGITGGGIEADLAAAEAPPEGEPGAEGESPVAAVPAAAPAAPTAAPLPT